MKIALLGYGTVGSGVYELLKEHRDRIANSYGTDIEVVSVLVRSLSKYASHEDYERFTDSFDVVVERGCDIAIETMGGIEPAYTYAKYFLSHGIPVITANKDLLAEKGDVLFPLSEQNKTPLSFEASVGGGIPILKPLRECLAGDRIIRIAGIVNGTTNYILTKMHREKLSYAQALEQAQKSGFAEANPHSDVEGLDAIRKIAILTRIAYGKSVRWDALPAEGITEIDAADIAYAEQKDYRIKLVGFSTEYPQGVFAAVMPVMVPRSSVFATVDNEYNLIEVEGSAVGTLRFSGKGAGKFPTATSIMGDLVDYIQNAKIEPIIAIEDATTLATIPEPSDWVIRLKGSFDKKAILEAFSDYSPELDDLGNSYLKIANIAEAPMIKILNRFDALDWKRYLIYEDLS